MVFLSLAARILVNVEALNMVESVGNVTRHRRATVIVYGNGGYKKFEVPAISGESIAHGFQEALVRAAREVYSGNPPVCEWCARGEFFKEMDEKHTIPQAKGITDITKFEEAVIKNCLVEDIGGFLRAEKPPVKRTSRFSVGYMVPALDAVSASSIESQFHVRHAPSESVKEEERAAQMIYYVELGSAVYGLGLTIDFDGIGFTGVGKVVDVLGLDERKRRAKVAMLAVQQLLEGFYGAKRTRFLPFEEVRSMAIAISDPLPFMLPPPSRLSFLEDAARKMKNVIRIMGKLGINETISTYAYSKERDVPDSIEALGSPEEVVEKAAERVLELMK